MKKMVSKLVAVVCLLAASSAYATDENFISKSITFVGVQGQMAYFSLSSYVSTPPLNNVIYIDLSTAGGRAAYAEVLAIKTSGQKVDRIIYDNPSSAPSYLQLIEYQ